MNDEKIDAFGGMIEGRVILKSEHVCASEIDVCAPK